MSVADSTETRPFSLEEEKPGPIRQAFTQLMIGRLIPAFFALLRRFKPVFRFPFTNTVIVTRFDDVQEICERHDDFPVPYQRMVDELSWEPSFLLAMKDTPEYRKILAQVRQLWRTEDLDRVREIARDASEQALREAGGRIDAIQELMVPVTIAVIEKYYGIKVSKEDWQPFRDGAMHIAGYLFGPQKLNQKKIETARRAINGVWRVIDKAIAAGHANPLPSDTIIGRCQAEGITDDAHLRSYLMGMIVGYLPTNTNANGRVLHIVLRNQQARKAAVTAAQAGDYDQLLKVLHEALRLNYILPGLWRTTSQQRHIREDTGRPIRIDEGRLIYISFMSAMKDRRRIERPGQFDPERSRHVYMVYGYRFHYCVGDQISDAMMKEIFMALMKRDPKPEGKLVMNGNFPWTQILRYQEA